ncbi:uncharacterized protein M8220_010020 [Acridotheres tristis]
MCECACSVCTCVSVFVCTLVCLYLCVMCVCICMFLYLCFCTSVCLYLYLCVPVFLYLCVCLYLYLCVPVFLYLCVPVYVHTSARAHPPHSYRRFCRLDDVSAQYWSRSGLPSASSLDNPAFSNSEELLHLQVLDSGCCGCRGDSSSTGAAKRGPVPCAHPQCQPSFHYDWDTSSSSMNDPMVDSGKASDISVSSWPMEPIQWGPFPLLHQLSRQRPHKARWPQSFSEGLELGTLERSWTA